jgi:hypothetical protein
LGLKFEEITAGSINVFLGSGNAASTEARTADETAAAEEKPADGAAPAMVDVDVAADDKEAASPPPGRMGCCIVM